MIAYLEFEDQPEKIIPYTLTLIQQRKNKIENFKSKYPEIDQKDTHTINVKINPKTGDPQNKILFAYKGKFSSFENNFKASAKGWKPPQKTTLVGPLRNCLYLKTFRSIKVKNATETNTKIKSWIK